MKKIILFILSLVLSVGCNWLIYFLYIKFLLNICFVFLPFVIVALIICYLIWKDKGCILIVGVTLGFIISVLLLLSGLI